MTDETSEQLFNELEGILNPGCIRIDVKPIELKWEKPLLCKYFCVELYSDHMIYKHDFTAEKPIVDQDADSGWEERRMWSESVHKREALVAIDLFKFNKEEKWQINIFVAGSSFDPSMYFTTQKEAERVYNIIKEWMLNK